MIQIFSTHHESSRQLTEMAEPVGGVEVRSVAVMGLSQAFTGGGGAGLVKSIKIENINKKGITNE